MHGNKKTLWCKVLPKKIFLILTTCLDNFTLLLFSHPPYDPIPVINPISVRLSISTRFFNLKGAANFFLNLCAKKPIYLIHIKET